MEKASNDLKYYRQLKDEMLASDRSRDEFFRKIDALDKVKWDLPAAMATIDGIHKVVSPDGRDAIRTATRTLAGTFPRIKWRPEANNEATKKQANINERMLEILLKNTSDRNEVSIQRDAVKMACKYDMVAAQIIYIPYQKKISEDYNLGGDVKHWEFAMRKGPFIVKFRDPQQVHIMRSDYGMTGVLYESRQKLGKIIEHWGADSFKGLYDKTKAEDLFKPYTVFDMTLFDERIVWVEGFKEPVEIMCHKHDLPFMGDWIARAGGTNVDEESQYAYEPLLASVVLSGQWETQNIVETLGVSDVIWRAANPRGIKKGVNADQIEQDFTKMGNDIVVGPGQEYTPIPPAPLDAAKFEIADRIADRMNRSSVARILQDAQMPANTAFAAINSVLGVASSMIRPHKMLAEQALSDILTRMVEWVSYSKEPLMIYGDGKKMDELGTTDSGQEYILDPAYFDPKSVSITVELEPELPLDKQQKINAASAAVTTLNYPLENALEDIGVNDPRQAMRQWKLEQLENTLFEAEKTVIMGEAQAKVQQMMIAIQQQAQQAQMAQQQEMAQQQQAPMTQDFNMQGTNTGEGFSVGEGGEPPALANPYQTREFQLGVSRAGEEFNV